MSNTGVAENETPKILKRKLADCGRQQYVKQCKVAETAQNATREALNTAYRAKKYDRVRALLDDWMITTDFQVSAGFQSGLYTFDFRFTLHTGETISVVVSKKYRRRAEHPSDTTYKLYIEHNGLKIPMIWNIGNSIFSDLKAALNIPHSVTQIFLLEFVVHLLMDIADDGFPVRSGIPAPHVVDGCYFVGPPNNRIRAFFQCMPDFANTAGSQL